MKASNVSGTGAGAATTQNLRPEWARERFFTTDDVAPLDAPQQMPAGACWKYEAIFHPGESWPMQQATFR